MENYDKDQFENTDNELEDIEETVDADELDEAVDAESEEACEDETEVEEAEEAESEAEADETEDTAAEEPVVAPIRTRSPEQNRSITNGIPMRHSATLDETQQAADDSFEKSTNKVFTIIIAAAIALFLLVMGLIIAVNVFNIRENSRPSDIDITLGNVDEDGNTDVTVVETPEDSATQHRVTLDFYQRKDIEVSTSEITVEKLLAAIGCVLDADEMPSVPMDTVIKEDMVITVDKYAYEIVTVDETIPYETRTIETDLIMKGTEELQEGEDGARTVEYGIVYVNGVESTRKVITETITKDAVDEVRKIGVGGEFVGADGKTYTYSMRKIVVARYYSLEGPTYFGPDADETVIVVDNDIIPLGTKLYVKNGEYDFGVRTAADIASSVVGDEIYIWISPSNPNYAALKATEPHTVDIYYID